MTPTSRLLLCALLLGNATMNSQAQPQSTGQDSSLLPGVQRGYVGLSGGTSKYDLRSGSSGFEFDDSDTVIKLYTGAYFHPNLGLELSYLDLGKARRIGGRTSARGLNVSLTGRLPLTTQLDLVGKLGTTYGRTHTQGFGGFGVQPGKSDGFGLSFGAGLRWAFSPQWSAVLEWERHRLHFADGHSDVDTTTLGVQFNY